MGIGFVPGQFVVVQENVFLLYSKTCVREPPSRLTLNSGWCGKRCLSYKGTCHVILQAKLHDMYLYKTTIFPHQPLRSISKVAVLHRFFCTLHCSHHPSNGCNIIKAIYSIDHLDHLDLFENRILLHHGLRGASQSIRFLTAGQQSHIEASQLGGVSSIARYITILE